MQTPTFQTSAPVSFRSEPSPTNGIGHLLDRVTQGDSSMIMKTMPAGSVDLIVTDPPYLVSYQSRDGRRIANDSPSNSKWLFDTSQEMFRVLKSNSFCISFYGWPQAGTFHNAWAKAGFRVVGNFVWHKTYASSTGYTRRHHECAALLAKGNPPRPSSVPSDVLSGRYTGNRLHPTQKPVDLLATFIRAYSRPGEVVLDPFAGSGSTAVAASQLKRRFIAIELMKTYADAAKARLVKSCRL